MTFGDRIQITLLQLWDYLSALFLALIILFAGYLLARLVEHAAERLLRKIHLQQALERGGIMEAVERSGSHPNPVRVVSKLIFWIVMFAVLLVATTPLGISLGDVMSEMLGYIPSVIASIVIIIVGIVLGQFVGWLILASAGGLHGGPILARIGQGGVILLAVFMALQQIGVATNIVTTAFAILFGAVAFAAALAFGLGNRDLAGEITRHWYERFRAEREAIAREAEAAEGEEGR